METDQAPAGRAIPNFPVLTEMTGGLRGLWVIGGMTGAGKSTLAANIVANVAGPDFPVLYLDLENDTGPVPRETAARIASGYGRGGALNHAYPYQRLADLEADRTRYFPAPALIVVDHLQHLARGDDSDQRRASLDSLIRQCQELVLEGYTVIALSQHGRRWYGQPPSLAAFKETGAIEAGAAAAVGIWQPRDFDPPRVRIVKLRHAAAPHHELLLRREGDGLRLVEDRRLALPARGERTPAQAKLSIVQKAVAKAGSPATTANILAAMKMLRTRRSTGERLIAEAVRRREIKQAGRGEYALVSFPQTSLTARETSEGMREAAISA